VIPVLEVALESEDLKVRCRAAIAIANSVSWFAIGGAENADNDVRTEQEQQRQQQGQLAREAIAAHMAPFSKQLLSSVLRHKDDDPKVSAPAFRAVGFLLAVDPEAQIINGPLREQALEALATCMGDGAAHFKSRVSACNAMAHVLANQGFNTSVAQRVADTATRDQNFKVRAAALSALSALGEPERQMFCEQVAKEHTSLEEKRASKALTTDQVQQIDKLLEASEQFLTTCPDR
jgi:hypothetical protein